MRVMPSASAEVQSQKCQSPPAAPHRLDARRWRFSLWELCCSVTWLSLCPLPFLPPQQTRTSRTMTRWTAAAPRPRPKEPRCPGGRRWAWVHFDALPPPPAANLQVRTTASPPKFIHEDVNKNKMTVFYVRRAKSRCVLWICNSFCCVFCREGRVQCWSRGWGGLHPGVWRCSHSAG